MTDVTNSESLTKFFEDIARPTQERAEIPPPPPPPPPPPVNTAVADDEPEPKPKVDKKLIEASAEMAIGMIDGIQTSIFKGLAQHRRGKRANEITGDDNGKTKLAKAVRDHKQNEKGGDTFNVLSATDNELLQLNEQVEEFINDLGFTEKQHNQIKQPLMYIIEANGGKIPMELWCIIGFSNAIGGNVAGLLTI